MDTEEISLVEQLQTAALHLSELGNGQERIYNDEQEEEEEDIELSLHTLLDFGRQITLGMVCMCGLWVKTIVKNYAFFLIELEFIGIQEYLVQKKIVHRNLAARNILVSQDWQLKIRDFGIYHDDLHSHEKIPLRWMALETILHKQFTTMSDV